MEEIQRISKIISSLLKFSRKGNMEFKKSDIRKELESVLSLVEKEMQLEGIQTIRKFDSEILQVFIDTDGMRQVFLNIINNAKFAMHRGGVFTVSTEVLIPEENWSFYQGKDSPTPNPKKIMRVKFWIPAWEFAKRIWKRYLNPFSPQNQRKKEPGLDYPFLIPL
jgi:signal transduction histidine kinase